LEFPHKLDLKNDYELICSNEHEIILRPKSHFPWPVIRVAQNKKQLNVKFDFSVMSIITLGFLVTYGGSLSALNNNFVLLLQVLVIFLCLVAGWIAKIWSATLINKFFREYEEREHSRQAMTGNDVLSLENSDFQRQND